MQPQYNNEISQQPNFFDKHLLLHPTYTYLMVDQSGSILESSNPNYLSQTVDNFMLPELRALIDSLESSPKQTRAEIVTDAVVDGDLKRYNLTVAKYEGKYLVEAADITEQAKAIYIKEIERINDLIRKLLAGLSHELRTPLAQIKTEIHLIEAYTAKGLYENAAKKLDNLVHHVDKLTRIAETLELFVRLDKSPESFDFQLITFNELWASLETIVKTYGVEVTLPTEGIQLYGSLDLLTASIKHLIANADEHGQRPIRMNIIVSSNCLSIEVINKVDPEKPLLADDLYQIEIPSYKEASDRTDSAGFGVGLNIAQESAKIHGGQLATELKPDETIFRFSLPAKISEVES